MQPMAMSLLFWSVSITRVVRKVATHCVLMIMTLRCSQSHGYSNMSIISRGSDCRSATKNVEFARVVCHLFGQDTCYFSIYQQVDLFAGVSMKPALCLNLMGDFLGQ